MNEPSGALQLAIFAVLEAAQIGAEIYDPPPPNPSWPYVVLGDDQTVAEHAECLSGAEVWSTIHVYSRLPGRLEAKTIAAAVVAALDGVEMTLEPGLTVEPMHHDSRFFTDPDGLAAHGVVTFCTLV